MDWDPGFLDRSPMLEPLREHAADLRTHPDWPTREHLQGLADARRITTAGGAALRFVAPAPEPYETRIRLHGEMHLRVGEWHDFFNALVWLAFPKTKRALNESHYAAWLRQRDRDSAGAEQAGRGSVRDALTVFDENGAIVVSSDAELLDDLRAFRWRRLFWERRDRVRAAMRFYVFGHALFEKALRPYVGMTAHAMLLPVDEELIAQPLSRQVERVDALAAASVPTLTATASLSPLPLLGVPGWWRDNEHAAFYDNADYFRAGRTKRWRE